MKNNKNAFYYLINFLFIIGAIIAINYSRIISLNISIKLLLMLLVLFVVIHIFKFIKIYFILLEEVIPLKKMIKLYVKTTFVSMVLPYKIGELFKMYSYGKEINNYSKGIVAVLIDKFFDALVLCIVLIPYGVLIHGNISRLAWIMLLFVLTILLIYVSFKGTYYYLNKFFIGKVKNKKSIYALGIIEKANEIYEIAKSLLTGRQAVILCLTGISWIVEAIFIQIMAGFTGYETGFMTIINYISDAFFGKSNLLFNNYIYLGTAIFLILILAIYIKKFINIILKRKEIKQ